MILFILIAACILLYSIFADEWLIWQLKRDVKSTRPVHESLCTINTWFWTTALMQAANYICVWLVSFAMLIGLAITCPAERSHWEFNINALEDNLVTQGQYYGRRGYVDGELSYFYSRSFANGEKIGHMSADKTYIKYDNDAHPPVEVHIKRIDVSDWMYKTFFLESMNKWSTEYYVLIVPEETITNDGQYEIDMR